MSEREAVSSKKVSRHQVAVACLQCPVASSLADELRTFKTLLSEFCEHGLAGSDNSYTMRARAERALREIGNV